MDCIITTKDGRKHKGVFRPCFKDGLFAVDCGSLRFIPIDAKISDIKSGFRIIKTENFDFETLKFKRLFLNAAT